MTQSCTRLNDFTSLLLPGPILSHSPWPWLFPEATAALKRCSWASSADTRQHRCPQSVRNIPPLGGAWQALAPCHNHRASKTWLCWDPKVPPQSCTRALRRWPEKTPDTRGAGRTGAPLPHASVQTQGRVVLSAPVTQIARGGHSRMSLAVLRKRLQKDTLTCHLLSLDLEQDRKPLALT